MINKASLESTFFLDAEHPSVQAYAQKHSQNCSSDEEKAISLYHQIRDEFDYSPYAVDLRRSSLPASQLIGQNHGNCVQKALLLVSSLRALKIPARLQFFIVKNHIGTGQFEKLLNTNRIVFHGGAQVYLNGKWLKLVPAFNQKLCLKLGVSSLDFDGKNDSMFQEYSDETQGKRFMEYIHDYGTFDDFPFELAISELKAAYPSAFDPKLSLEQRIIFKAWD